MYIKRVKFGFVATAIGLFILSAIKWSNINIRRNKNNTKYILLWTLSHTIPFRYLESRQTAFIRRNCSMRNCFVVFNEPYYNDTSHFDAILFHGPELSLELKLPEQRYSKQKYIYVSIESSKNYLLCHRRFNNFFDWTWTYKLNSNISYSYLSIRNKEGEVIGPKEDMHWMKAQDMMPISNNIKQKLRSKRKLAAWFVSNCDAISKRQKFVENLQVELNIYNLGIDIYGGCGPYKCNVSKQKECFEMVEKDYYFYLSFENSFSEDYATEKLLNPLQHYTVPVVYGGANYTRFMPDGIYLNALVLGAKKTAKEMSEIFKDPKRYENFFKWHNYYSYHDPGEKQDTDHYCNLCAFLNNKEAVNSHRVYENFLGWWNNAGIRC